MFLVKIKNPSTKHIWRNEDTVCRQASTGGLAIKNYRLVEMSGLPVCAMCQRKEDAYRGKKCN